MFFVKAIGLLMLFSVCALVGLLKSYELKCRKERLLKLSKQMKALSEYVRIGNSERKTLIEKAFGDDFSIAEDNIKGEYLKKEDKKLFSEFFSEFGKSEKKAEYDKVLLYANFLNSKLQKAEADCERLSRLYGETGVLAGLAIVIFLI